MRTFLPFIFHFPFHPFPSHVWKNKKWAIMHANRGILKNMWAIEGKLKKLGGCLVVGCFPPIALARLLLNTY